MILFVKIELKKKIGRVKKVYLWCGLADDDLTPSRVVAGKAFMTKPSSSPGNAVLVAPP